MKKWFCLAGMLLAAAGAPALAAGDARVGAKVFSAECSECHSVKEGRNKKGPSLFALLGRKAGTVPEVDYSEPLRKSGWVWNEETLRRYLGKATKETNPGSKMKYDGLRDAQALEDLLAYFNTVK
ncbi:MAG: c-type cytochrome [Pseudomonadota bacterium]